MLGYVERGGLITAPLFGYDTGLPQSLGLYRMLSALVALEGLRRQKEVHLSAGVGGFKRARGGLRGHRVQPGLRRPPARLRAGGRGRWCSSYWTGWRCRLS